MQAEVKWVGGSKFLGTSGSGHHIVMDSNAGEHAPGAMEMVLMAAGGCSSTDVVFDLRKAGQKVRDCVAQLTAQRRETAPRLFTQIHIHFVVSGEDLEPELVERITAASLAEHCSVCLMLGKGVELTHSWEIAD